MNLSEIQEKIESQEPIRFKGLYKKTAKKDGIITFIRKILTEYSNNHDTIFVKSKKVLSPEGKSRRSLNEIYLLTKYYFPYVKLITVIETLFRSVEKVNGFRYTYCSQHNRKMFYYSSSRLNWMEPYTTDQFGNSNTFYLTLIKEKNET